LNISKQELLLIGNYMAHSLNTTQHDFFSLETSFLAKLLAINNSIYSPNWQFHI